MKWAALSAFLFLAGCINVGNFCDLSRVHRFSDTTIDQMTDEEIRQEELHNRLIDKYCS